MFQIGECKERNQNNVYLNFGAKVGGVCSCDDQRIDGTVLAACVTNVHTQNRIYKTRFAYKDLLFSVQQIEIFADLRWHCPQQPLAETGTPLGQSHHQRCSILQRIKVDLKTAVEI